MRRGPQSDRLRGRRVLAAAAVLLLAGWATPTASGGAPDAGATGAPALHPSPAYLAEREGRPVGWDACRPVPWVADLRAAPPGAGAVLVRAVAELSRLSGLELRYAGSTTVPLTSDLVAPGAPRRLVVGWTTAGRSDLLRDRPRNRTVGVTRVAWTAEGGGRPHLVAAVVAMNAEVSAPADGPGSWFAYLLHELGHAVGLAHVEAGTGPGRSLMTGRIDPELSGFTAADAAGLRALGTSRACPDGPQDRD